MGKPKQPRGKRSALLTTRLRRYFLAGLATLFPIIVTLYVLVVIFQFADGLLGRFINRYWVRTYGYEIPGLGLLITVLLIVLVGILSSYFFGQWAVRRFEAWFSRLPLIRRIYQPVKQLAQFLFGEGNRQTAFRRVVLVQYPRPGCYSIAFVTNEPTSELSRVPSPLVTLLIPNPPSPFTGPIIFVPKEEVIPLDMTIEEAIKLVVSGGVVTPPLEAAKPPKQPV